MKKIVVERQYWPGNLDVISDNEAYLFAALDPLEAVWNWDDPRCHAACVEVFNKDQLALWAIWNIDGQINNGGVIQALWNSFGELCEEAVSGFRHFDLHEHASLLDEAFSMFERPISLRREERRCMLERILKHQSINGDPLGVVARESVSALFTAGSARVSAIENRYFDLNEEEDTLGLLARIVDRRKDQYFLL